MGKIQKVQIWQRLQKQNSQSLIGSEELKHVESAGEKFKRKFWENPVLPVGAGLTTLALLLGLRAFRRQDKHMSQLMMRARVGAQGFTVLALLGGVLKTAFDAKQ